MRTGTVGIFFLWQYARSASFGLFLWRRRRVRRKGIYFHRLEMPSSSAPPPVGEGAPAATPRSVSVEFDADIVAKQGEIIAKLQQRLDELEAKHEQLQSAAAKQNSPTHAVESKADHGNPTSVDTSVDTVQPAESQAEDAEEVAEGLFEELAEGFETADAADIANIFSYAVEEAIDSDSPVVIARCLLSLYFLLFIQVLYVFGYYDASMLYFGTNMLPAFQDEIDKSVFYSSSIIPATNLSYVNLLASLCSLTLLALVMKNDNEATLLTTAPLQHLLLGDGDHLLPDSACAAKRAKEEARSSGQSALGRALRRVGRVLLLVFLQMNVLARALLLPLYAAFGAAGNFAGAADAQEVVLNSVAIGFVFELDEQLFEWLIKKEKRVAFEEGPPRPMSPLSSRHPSGTTIVSNWCWLCVLLDIAMPTYYYCRCAVRLDTDALFTTPQMFLYMGLYVLLRLAFVISASLHIAYRCGGSKLGMRPFLTFAVVYTLFVVAVGAFLWTYAVAIMQPWIGMAAIAPLARADTMCCLFMAPCANGVECRTLHLQPNLYSELATLQEQYQPSFALFSMAWGGPASFDEEALMVMASNLMSGALNGSGASSLSTGTATGSEGRARG